MIVELSITSIVSSESESFDSCEILW